MIKNIIKYLVISDIHLGNNRNQTVTIVQHLNSYFKDNIKTFKSLDIIFIAGDTYDKLLHHYSTDAIEATAWLSKLCSYCIRNNIKLRILEGTSSHDWKQVKTFYTALMELDSKVDFKYIESVAIEKIDNLGISVLYVPDEWRPKTEDTFSDVKEELAKNNLTKVDIAIMHGQFNYQMPEIANTPKHNEHDYLDIVTGYIHIGHIHTHSVFNRIIAQGSFDRMRHGEEEKKGGVLVTLNKETGPSYRFIVNKNATIFKTIKITSKKLDKVKEEIDKVLSKLDHTSSLCLSIDKDNPVRTMIKEIKQNSPLVRITIKDSNKEDKNALLVIDSSRFDTSDLITITEDNIVELIMTESKPELTVDEHLLLGEELKEVTCR